MWRITTHGFTLEEVLILCAMNLIARLETDPRIHPNSVADRYGGHTLEIKHSIKRAGMVLGLAL
jgi:hypothetical protein